MTTQINKSQIFKSAWVLVKTTVLTLSQALKQAWAEAKEAIASIPVMPLACAVVAPETSMTEEEIDNYLLNEVSFKRFTHRNTVVGLQTKFAVYKGYAMDEDERLFKITSEQDGKIVAQWRNRTAELVSLSK